MTAQQTRTIAHIQNDLASDRAAAELNARPVLMDEQIEENVIIAVQVKIEAGLMDEARAMWRAYRDSQKASK